MDAIDLVSEALCRVKVVADNKEDLLMQLAQLLAAQYTNVTAEEIHRGLLERENLGTTGFGEGLAIPHAKLDNIDRFSVAVVTLKKGVDFDAIDKRKVKIAIAILGPTAKQKEYLRLLASISKNIKNKSIINEMIAAESPSALIEAFARGTHSRETAKKEKQKNKLLIIHLKEHKFFDDIINRLLERELTDAVITDTSSIETYLADSPLFSGFLNFLAERSGSCKTIMVAVNEEVIPVLIREIEDIMGDLDTHTGIQVIGLDIAFIKGAV